MWCLALSWLRDLLLGEMFDEANRAHPESLSQFPRAGPKFGLEVRFGFCLDTLPPLFWFSGQSRAASTTK
jgi:hypothetical protein